MEWKSDKISKIEMEKKQAEYIKKAIDMANIVKKSKPQIINENKIKNDSSNIKENSIHKENIAGELKENEEIKKIEIQKHNSGAGIEIKENIIQPPEIIKPNESAQLKQFIIPNQHSQPENRVEQNNPPTINVSPQPPIKIQQAHPVLPPQPSIILAKPSKRFVMPINPIQETQNISENEKQNSTSSDARTTVLEKTTVEAELEIGFSGILTEQETIHINPQQEIPEKVKNYEKSSEPMETIQGKMFNECVCNENFNDVKNLKDKMEKTKNTSNVNISVPPNFNEFIKRHNRRFEDSPNNFCKIHGPHRRESSCPQCSSKKNWI